MTRPTPLEGVRIVDLTQVLAGPYGTYQLALLGAEVIKVEQPGGEWARRGGGDELAAQGLGLSFCTQNSDKQFVEVDLKDPAGLESVMALIESAHIFIQNYAPGTADRLGLGIDAVQARNPLIIYCSVSAYGADGPLGGRPAYDHVVQAMSGIMETTGTNEMGPTKVGAPYVDYATGLNTAFALMSALAERARTGQGQVVDISMLDTALNLMASNVTNVATRGRDLPKLGNEAASRAPSSGCFAGSDGSTLMLAANNEAQFKRLCACLGHAEWANDERWATPAARRQNQDELRVLMIAAFATDTAANWEQLLVEHRVPASRVRKLTEVIAEGQPAARGLLHEMTVGDQATSVHVPGIGFRLNGDSLGPRRPPQPAGTDNDRWLSG